MTCLLILEYSVDFATRKALREACRQYAYLPRLLESVFEHIRIQASPEQVEVAESIDLCYIRPYVRVITMTPSKYSWKMTKDVFQHVISTPRIEEICKQIERVRYQAKGAYEGISSLPTSGDVDIKESGWKTFVEKHSDGKTPFSETEMTTAYERYMQHAERLREMFETKRIHRAWTRVLCQLPHARSFKFGIWKFDGRNSGSWRDLACDFRTHAHNHLTPGHEAEVCRQLQEPIGEQLLKTIIASLIAAKSTIVQLEIECTVDSNFVWADDGTLDNLDLSRLEALSFNPVEADWIVMRLWSSERETTAATRCGLALSTLLHKCSSTLQKLIVYSGHGGGCDYAKWPPAAPNQIPLLPVLTNFTTGMDLGLPAFAGFLLQSPALAFLNLNGCGGNLDQWRQLWDAIRDHPSRMMLEFEQLPCNDVAEWSTSHYTGRPSEAKFDEDPWMNIDYSLENYLSGLRHWDRTLDMWFNGGEGEPTDSEEDDSDDDNDSGNDDDDDRSSSDEAADVLAEEE